MVVAEKMKVWLDEKGFVVEDEPYIRHTAGLPPYRIVLQPKVEYTDGVTYVFVDERAAFIASLSTPILYRDWRVIERIEYNTLDELERFLEKHAKKKNEKSPWDEV